MKKSGLDCNVLSNFRPVSNLPFLAKVLEKVVLKQLQEHLSTNNLIDVFQSAYRKDHSTETAVLSVLDSLLTQNDEKQISLVALLDLSAAFDTLDHSVMLQRLNLSFGFRGYVLKWFESYVSDRFQRVLVGDAMSEPSPLLFGVPQGSVLGPVLFSLYSQPLSDVLSTHGCQYHKYADDTELSSSAPPNNFSNTTLTIQSCVHEVSKWMHSNKLKINAEKTEVMSVGSKSRLEWVDEGSLNLSGTTVLFQTSVKYLGVRLDQTLSMHEQISSVSRACFLELRRIASLRPFLSRDAILKLVVASVLSRLDYCNSALFGLPDDQILRLQRIQNSAARFVMGKKKYDHVTPLLRELHWLPVKARCEYKIAVLAYRHFDGTLAPYLSNLLCAHEPPRTLRSSREKRLVLPKVQLKSAGERSFRFAAPSVWNALPTNLRDLPSLLQFKTGLKTYLFNKHVL